QRSCGNALREHACDENRPGDSEQHNMCFVPEVVNAFSKFMQVAFPRVLPYVRWDVARLHRNLTFAYGEVADQRYRICRCVQREHTAEVDVLIHESDDGSGNHPPALYAG